MSDKEYTKEEVIEAIKENWVKEFGKLSSSRECCERSSGYFTVGFVIDSINKIDEPQNKDNNSDISFTKADTNLMREWFDAVSDLNPDYLEAKDYTLAKKLYSESELRTPNEVLEKANGTEEETGRAASDVNARVSLPKPKLSDTDLLRKVRGATKPGRKVEIHWTTTYEPDEGYIFTTPECQWDEGDVFIHIPETYDGNEEWKHLYELLESNIVSRIEVAT